MKSTTLTDSVGMQPILPVTVPVKKIKGAAHQRYIVMLSVNRLLCPVHTERHNVTLMGGTFDLFDGQNGLHTHLPVNVTFFTLTVTLMLGVNRP